MLSGRAALVKAAGACLHYPVHGAIRFSLSISSIPSFLPPLSMAPCACRAPRQQGLPRRYPPPDRHHLRHLLGLPSRAARLSDACRRGIEEHRSRPPRPAKHGRGTRLPARRDRELARRTTGSPGRTPLPARSHRRAARGDRRGHLTGPCPAGLRRAGGSVARERGLLAQHPRRGRRRASSASRRPTTFARRPTSPPSGSRTSSRSTGPTPSAASMAWRPRAR